MSEPREGTKPVSIMTNKELRAQIEHIAKMLTKGPVGSTLEARTRITHVIREAARRMRPDVFPSDQSEPRDNETASPAKEEGTWLTTT